jgi:RNA polymerase sigma-70 factor (ECF subfamily)
MPEPPDFPASQLFLRRLAFSLVRDEARAEDLVQDTWATWAAHRPSGLAEPRAWLARVLRNRAFNVKRGDERRAEREELAGQPDPSAPETDGTLEAQAQLIEALRKLEEPYRSTLVQRYYHDLSPRAIAERSGTPLDTVKARLVRGLAKLRGEMDRRYGGDRGAWCHWLAMLNAPPVPVAVPGGAQGGPGAAPFAGMGGGLSLLGLLGVAAALAVGAVLRSGWPGAARGEKGPPERREASVPAGELANKSSELGRVPAERSERVRTRAKAAPERAGPEHSELPERPVGDVPPPLAWLGYGTRSSGREDFEWPQYAGGADHDTYRDREDEIRRPEVRWFLPGCAGPPTLSGGDLYAGGLTLLRVDPVSGVPTGASLELLSQALDVDLSAVREGGIDGLDHAAASGLLKRAEALDPNDAALHMVAPAPVITKSLVIARRTRDGGVSAFDRELEREAWRWDPPAGGGRSDRIPPCLADEELVLVAHSSGLTALSAEDGTEAWTFTVYAEILAVPACAGGRAFFGTEGGRFFAVDLRTGERVWQTDAGSPGWSMPVVSGKRVLVADRGVAAWERGGGPSQGPEPCYLHAFDAGSGRVLWRSELEGSSLGLGLCPSGLYGGFAGEVALFDLRSGKRHPRERIETDGRAAGAPAVVGESLVFGDLDGHLYVYELGTSNLRWAFHVPGEVHDFVHTGERLYVATSIGLFCLGNAIERRSRPPEAAGSVLEWEGDPRKPSFLDDG